MTKVEFQELLHRYTSSTRDEADQVLALERQYPYSQLLHSLAARVSKDHGLENQQQELQLAAVYAADRHVLKELMSKSLLGQNGGASTLTIVHSTIDAVDYADEVVHDLEILHELKHNFEMLFDERSKKKPLAAEKESAKPKSHAKAIAHTSHKKSAPAKKSGKKTSAKSSVKTKAHGTKKAAKPATKVAKGKAKVAGKLKKAKPLKKKLKNGDDLLLEIEASKRKLRVENPKQQEQINLIDQFIKAQPSISNAREKGVVHVPTGDLAAFKQGEFGDQIISETLVGILISQGKKEKAIEVLKKLIWKFPQKKAYFAAQIEELKK